MINFPDTKKADYMTIDVNGLRFVYMKDELICLINKDGIRNIPFKELDKDTLNKIKEDSMTSEEGMRFTDGDKSVNLKDLL